MLLCLLCVVCGDQFSLAKETLARGSLLPMVEPLPLPAECKGIPKAIRCAQLTKKPAGVVKKIEKVVKKLAGKRVLKDTRECIYSRAYHSTLKATGLPAEARKAGQSALVNAFGSCSSRSAKIPCAM